MEHGGRVFLHIDVGQLELARQQNKNAKSNLFIFLNKNYHSDMWDTHFIIRSRFAAVEQDII